MPEDLPVPFVQSIAMTFGFTITALAYADVVNPRRVFVIGPVTGATVAAAYYKVINAMQDKEAENEPAAADRADTDVKPVEA